MQTFREKKNEMERLAEAAAPFRTEKAVQSGAPRGTNVNTSPAVPAASVPAVSSQVNKSAKPYDPNVNYMQNSMDAARNGDLAGAMYNERMHNIKDGDMGLGYGASGMWNYQDTQGFGGQLDAKYREIEDYFNNGFEYDYRDDDRYKAILQQKQKEADKAYSDGYAALSTQFDGAIPVNMINKLQATKSDIIDQADSYIPQLWQMAQDMHISKGNQLYNQYGILADRAAEDYNKFLTDRNFRAQGVNDAYDRRVSAEQYKDSKEYRDKVFDYGVEQDLINRQESDADAIANYAYKLYSTGNYADIYSAMAAAEELYRRAAGTPPVSLKSIESSAEKNKTSGNAKNTEVKKSEEPTMVGSGYAYVDKDGKLKILGI